MADWAFDKSRGIWYEYLKYNHTAAWLIDAFAAALRQADADADEAARKQEQEKCSRCAGTGIVAAPPEP